MKYILRELLCWYRIQIQCCVSIAFSTSCSLFQSASPSETTNKSVQIVSELITEWNMRLLSSAVRMWWQITSMARKPVNHTNTDIRNTFQIWKAHTSKWYFSINFAQPCYDQLPAAINMVTHRNQPKSNRLQQPSCSFKQAALNMIWRIYLNLIL